MDSTKNVNTKMNGVAKAADSLVTKDEAKKSKDAPEPKSPRTKDKKDRRNSGTPRDGKDRPQAPTTDKEKKNAEPESVEKKKVITKNAEPESADKKKAVTKNAEPESAEKKKAQTKNAEPESVEKKKTVTKNAEPESVEKKKAVTKNEDVKSASAKSKEEKIDIDVEESGRILALCQKGEWITLDQMLRSLEKNNPELTIADENGLTPLMIAVRENKLVIAERLLDLGVGFNERTKDGRTVMHIAASCAKEDIMKLLLNRKADPLVAGGTKEQYPIHLAASRSSGAASLVQLLLRAGGKDMRMLRDKDGSIALMHGAENGSIAVCRELLTLMAETQVKAIRLDTGDTPLHIACRRRDVDLAKLFLDNGADVDAQNEDGQTPLHLAAWEGDEIMVKFLHVMKANANISDKNDRSPLHTAAERGHTAIVEILVDKLRANVLARTKDGSTLMHVASQHGHPETAMTFLKKGVPLHMPNKAGAVCLHAAARKGHASVVKSLLLKGSLVDSVTKDNYTALHIAVECCKPLVVQTLLGFGAHVEMKGGKAQETALHVAARVKDGETCAEMLLKSGANVNATQENGEGPLHIAARHGLLKMVDALLQEGADPTAHSKSGETPLHIAVRFCHHAVAKHLIAYTESRRSRVDAVMLVNHPNLEGETAVHFAAQITKLMTHCEFEDTDLIKLLLVYQGDTGVHTKLTQETPLHYCARAGNEDILTEIIHYFKGNVQIMVNKQAKNGWSPLLVAAEEGHLKIVNILLQNHARVDVFDENGKAALHLAAENGHNTVAAVLLDHKAFVNAKSKLGVTPLHLAAQYGYNRLVKTLVELHKAIVDILSLAKKTPLHLAAQNGRLEVCSTLLKLGGDANAVDIEGQTPLHLSAENDHSDTVKLFLKHKPELVTVANTHGMTCAHIAASKGSVAVIKELMRSNKVIVITARNKTTNSTALHLAAEGGHIPVIQFLIDSGANALDENSDGMTAMHLAAKFGHESALETLQSRVGWKLTSRKTGLTPLHVAAQYGQVDFVREMLFHVPATLKSDVSYTGDGMKDLNSEYGLTPLHLAAQSGHECTVRLLLNSPGVFVDAATTVLGTIPLHLAAQNGHTAVVSLLLSKSTSQLQVKDKRGRTALHLASANGHLDMVALLLGQGADIDSCDKNGWTAMHYSAKAGFLSIVKFLVESGASPKLETKDGKVSLCYAAAVGHTEVVSYLMRKDHNTPHLMEDHRFVFDLMICGKMNKNKTIQEFILLSPAPVDTAAKLSNSFRSLAMAEKERAKDLVNAGAYCESMAVELTAIAAGVGANTAGALLKSLDCRNTPFLDVLIENEQKEVVAHPLVQKYLSDVWIGNLRWSTWKLVVLFIVLLICPVVWILISLPLRHRFNKIPIIKFMAYLVSHMYLICLYVITTVVPIYPIWTSGTLIPHWYEWLLLVWISGNLVSELTNPGDRDGLGWIKVMIIAFTCVGVTIHIAGFLVPASGDRLVFVYIRNQFLGMSLLLCCTLLLDFLSFHHLFGPWAIIIRDLMKDLTRFVVILCIFMAGFTFNLATVYQQTYPPIAGNLTLGDGSGAGGAKDLDLYATFEILFFSLFGLVEPENLPPVNRNPYWSLYLVKAVFGIYMIVTLIVLINLLIAMMSDTYQRIQAQSDVEWKFGRAKLIRNMNRTSATPSPLILFTKLFQHCRLLCKNPDGVCGGEAGVAYVEYDEVDDFDSLSDSRSVDMLAQTSNHWMRNVVRRNTKISPEGAFGHRLGDGHRGNRIENVVDWESVCMRYLVMQGYKETDLHSESDISTAIDHMREPRHGQNNNGQDED